MQIISLDEEHASEHLEYCACRNKGHKNLKEWYDDYRNDCYDSDRGYTMYDELLDEKEVEQEVYALMPNIKVSHNCCTSCQDLLDTWPETLRNLSGQGNPHYQRPQYSNVLQFDASRRKSCYLCMLFTQCVTKRGHTLERFHKIERRLKCLGKASTISVSIMRDEREYYCLKLTWPGHDSIYSISANPLYVIPNDAAPCTYNLKVVAGKMDTEKSLGGFASGQSATSTTIEKPTTQLELAKRWLDACLDTHDACTTSTKEDSRLPTRLLDVGSKDLRLVITDDWEERPRYATLSHRWGNIDFIRLREELMESFMTAIPLENLTKTFRDAVKITQNLGLDYLWIDALCITQNSNSDWEKESAMMRSVYGGATVNIAASGAINGNSGCFLKRDEYVGKVHFTAGIEGREMAWDIAPSIFYDSVARSPLAGRAWSLQERLLAARTLFFSDTEMFWGCKVKDAYESFPEGTPHFSERHIFHLEKRPLSHSWNTIVKLYTLGELTFSEDKLVAISGIARAVQQETHDQYLAGLWRKDIEFQLCWCSTRRLPQHMNHRAPSWSWASVDGLVTSDASDEKSQYKHYAHVVDAFTIPSGQDPMGKVSGGQLTIGCTSMLLGELYESRAHQYEVKLSSSEDYDVFRVYADSDEDVGHTVYMLPLMQTVKDFGVGKIHKDKSRNIQGLILASSKKKKGQYRRTGYFHYHDFDAWHQDVLYRFDKALDVFGATVAESGCAEVLSELEQPVERYIITVV